MNLAIGTANFGKEYGLNKKKLSQKDLNKIRNLLLKSKIKIFDTSQLYQDSEQKISSLKLKNLNIITKLAIKQKNHKTLKELLNRKIFNSLNNLGGVKNIYGVLIHDSKDLINKYGKKIIEQLKYLKKRGIIQNVGISIYDPKELDNIWKFWKPDIVQAPLNILDQRIIETGWLKKLKKNKVKFFSRSIFLQGLLINKNKNIILKKNQKKKLKQFYDWCKIEKVSRVEACMQYVKQYNSVDFIIIGFDNFKQLKQLIEIFNKKTIEVPDKFKTKNLDLIDPRKWKIKKK